MTHAAAFAAMIGALTACDNGPSAVAERPQSVAQASVTDGFSNDARGPQVDRRDTPAPEIDGRPMWSANRKFSAEENAQRAFARNGEAFGASSVDDFVRKAHAFITDPPVGTARLQRANGDVLLYDAKSNVFAVVSKAGAPRTMFKPDNGKAYWDEQKSRESSRQTARSESRSRDNDEG